MFRKFGIATAIAAALSVPIVVSSGTSAGSVPIDDVAIPTTTSVGPVGEAAGAAPQLEVVHVETDTNFASMTTQGTVLFAETMAPTDGAQPGWWLHVDVTVRNNGDEPIEATDLGITTDVSALDVGPLETPVVIAPGNSVLLKPHDITGSGTPPTWFTINVYAPAAAPFPAQATYPLDVYDDATATGGYRFPTACRRPAARRVLDARRIPQALPVAAVCLRPRRNSLGSRPRQVEGVHRAGLRRRGERDRTRLEERALPHLGPTRVHDGEWLERLVPSQ